MFTFRDFHILESIFLKLLWWNALRAQRSLCSAGFRGMCEVMLRLSRSAVWKGDKVHYAHLPLALSHEICENEITQHQIVAFIKNYSGRHLFKYLLSGAISKRSDGDIFLCGCVSVSFSPQWWWQHKPWCDRGQMFSIQTFSLCGTEDMFAVV